HARGFLDRRLEYAPDRDGMAWLSAYLPADQASGIWDRTTSIARALQGPAEDRTLTQRRADVAATLLLSGTTGTDTGHGASAAGSASADRTTVSEAGSAHTSQHDDNAARGTAGRAADTTAEHAAGGVLADAVSIPGGVHPGSLAGVAMADVVAGRVPTPSAQVLLTVPVFSLMGLTDEPADLDGYGPIPASMARKLVADGASSFRRVLTDPKDGVPLEIGRASYPIPAAMRQWLRLRDGRCTFPGCTNHSLDNDTDHILAWADGGTTGVSNLESLCRKHPRLKHTTAWTPSAASMDKPPGWTSPTGRHYPSEHHHWEPPQVPPQILAELKRAKPGAATSESGPPGDTP
ncbi:MAG: endonuclease, partial [Pseudarthrobacter sp.]|nr:endonuclease [Pseudarthrobacter sp.]